MSAPVPPGANGPVRWSAQGVPSSALYGDVYHSESGALAQARHVFLAGNGLPARWQRQPRFTILETGFGLGLNFLATWQAWRDDAARCARLDVVSIESHPVTAADILQAVARDPALAELAPLAAQLAARYRVALPGLHRIEFEHASHRIVLTLAVGDAPALLRDLHLAADAVFLDGFSPALNPDMWSPALMKSVARLMRPAGTAATWSVAAVVRHGLAQAGFQVEKVAGLPPKRDALRAVYAPAWARPASWPDTTPRALPHARQAVVIGAGLAGASAAHALARRGWRITMLDAAAGPAGGASGLPVGLMTPHVSPDDAPISRLTRSGSALMQALVERLALPARHARRLGVLQMADGSRKGEAPLAWADSGFALHEARTTAHGRPARYFPDSLAIEPAALVRALLAACDGIESRFGQTVAALARTGSHWQVLDADGRLLAQAPVVVVAAALPSLRLAGRPDALRAVRGRVTLGRQALTEADGAPPMALGGDGHFVPALAGDSPWHWLMGASYERGPDTPEQAAAAHAANFDKLARLAPALAPRLAAQFQGPDVREWSGVRCASPDRLPLVGPVGDGGDADGLHLLAALGSRGLSLVALCAELLACRIEGEPWPVQASLARALDPRRFADPHAGGSGELAP